MSFDVRIYPKIQDLPGPSWDALDGVREAPFLSHAWLAALEATGCVGGGTGWHPHHLAFFEGERLVAAAPAYLKEHSDGEFVFDWAWASAAHRANVPYYPKLIVAVPFTPATAPRLLVADPALRPRLIPVLAAALRRLVAAGGMSGAHVLFPTEGEASGLAEAGLAHRYGVQFHWHNQGYQTFEDFLGRFSSKRRNQIRRERREMQRQGITLTTECGRLAPELIDTMFGYYLATVDKFAWGRRYLTRAFFEEICDKLAGKVELVLAREGARPVGGAFNIVGETTLFGRYWGASEERPFLHFNVCFYHSIEMCIARGLSRFEPGAGGEHKLVRGFEPCLTHSAHHLEHPGLERAVRDFLVRERAAMVEGASRKEVAFR